jgi:hypothetical protein
VHALGDVLEESGSDLVVGGVLGEVDGDQELLSLSVDITNVDTTLVGEEDPVTLGLLAHIPCEVDLYAL